MGVIIPLLCFSSQFTVTEAVDERAMPFQSTRAFGLGPYCSQISLVCQLG